MIKSVKINKPINSFNKKIYIEGDKSLSIRWALISSQSEGKSVSYNLLRSEDVIDTLKCLKKLGVKNIKYFHSQPWPFPASLMLGFFAEAESTKLDIDYNEIEDAHWFSIEELKLLQHPSIKNGFKLPRIDSIARRLVDTWINKFN